MKKISSFLNNVGKILSQISIRYFYDFRPKIFEYLHILNFAVIVWYEPFHWKHCILLKLLLVNFLLKIYVNQSLTEIPC